MNLLEIRGPRTFGPWAVTQVVEWEGEAFPHTFLFPNIPIDQIREASPSGSHSRLTENGMIVTANQFFVLHRDELVFLIEMGSGNGKARPAEPYWDNQNLPYLETLAALNVRPEEVAFVFLSHAHLDHVGLATTRDGERWVPTFPRAKYVLHPAEWKYWSEMPSDDPRRHPSLEDSVRPLVEAGCIHWAQDGEVLGGLRIHAAPGHTPGNLLFEVEGQNVWFVGDLLHHPAQVAHPEWASASFDFDSELNTRQRRHYFQCFADTHAVVYAEHVGDPFRVNAVAAGKFFARYD